MSEKRFKKGDNLSCVDTEIGKSYWYACNLCGLLNEQQDTNSALKEENEQLRTQLLICQQSKSDNKGFQVWEVPPIPKGKRISFTTYNDGGDGV